MGKDLVNELYKFINSDESVTFQKLKEASDAAYANFGTEDAAMLKEHEALISDPAFTSRMPQEDLQVTSESMLSEWDVISKDEAFLKEHINEVAPEGWEGTVKAMKKEKKISNPYALAWSMKNKGYKPHKADEGKLVADPSVATPDQIQTLAEEKKEKKAEIKTANAGVTEEPEKGKLQKDMDKATPDVDKLSDFQVAAKVNKATKEEPRITGVSKDSDKELKDEKNNPKVKEGKLPADPSVATPDQIQTLAEERALVTVSDEHVAKDIAAKYPGGRVVPDSEKKQFVVMVQEKAVVKEEKTTEPKGAAISAGEVPGVKDEKDSKLTNVSKSDPKEPSIKSAEANVGKEPKDSQVGDKGASTAKQSAPADQKIDPGSPKVDKTQDAPNVADSQKTTEPAKPAIQDTNSVAGTSAKKEDKLTAEAKVEEAPKVEEKKAEEKKCECKCVKEEVEVTVKSDDNSATVSVTPTGTSVSTSEVPATPALEPAPAPVEDEIEFSDEMAEEMAEKIFVSDYLTSLGEAKLTEKQKKFVGEVTEAKKKIGKKSQCKVDKKLCALKDKKAKAKK